MLGKLWRLLFPALVDVVVGHGRSDGFIAVPTYWR